MSDRKRTGNRASDRIWLALGIWAWFATISGVAVGQLSPPPAIPAGTENAPTLTAEAIWSLPQARPNDQLVLAIVLQIAPDYHINPDASQIQADDLFTPLATEVKIQPTAGLTLGSVVYPPPTHVAVAYADGRVPAYDERIIFYLPVLVNSDAGPGPIELSLGVFYQTCNATQCLMPQTLMLKTTLEIVAPDAPDTSINDASVDPQLFADFDQSVFATMLPKPPPVGPPPPNDTVDFHFFKWQASGGVGMAVFFLLAALGGLLLNFTPCVLPVIPLKIMALSRSEQNRARRLALGTTMSVGIVGFWLIIGILITAIGSFQAINQLYEYPAFTIAVGVVIAIMAVGMCGLFALRLPQFVYAIRPRQDSHRGSLGFGMMTAILSTPCTAPFMGTAAAWAIVEQSPAIVLSTFGAIGVGMSSPYLLLSAMPQWIEKMPRTGPGSELLKQVMGLLMLATASFFVGVGILSIQVDGSEAPSQAYWIPVALCLAGAGLWLGYRTYCLKFSNATRVILGGLSVAMLVLAAVTWPSVGSDQEAETPLLWAYYTPPRLAAVQAQGRTVVLDFTAEWCINCKVMEATILDHPQVTALLESPDVVAMKVDLTGNNAAGAALLAQVGRVGIPLLVILSPAGQEVFNSHFYTVEALVEAIQAARGHVQGR